MGIFLGLTGLATHYCPSERISQVKEKLESLGHERCCDMEAVSAAIREVTGDARPSTEKAVLEPNAASIERCFGSKAASAEVIVERLEAEGSAWSEATLQALRQRSPLSVKIALEAIRRHQAVSLKEAFITEYRLAQWCMRPPPLSDFCEGIRAVLID